MELKHGNIVLSLKVSPGGDLWWIKGEKFRYSHLFGIGLVDNEPERYRSFQVVFLGLVFLVSWRSRS
jgi:hypothetical protein